MDTITADSAARPAPVPSYSHEVRWLFDPDGVKSPFAFTLGLGARPGRAYELACTTLPAEESCATLNNTAEQLVADCLDPVDGLELDDVLIGFTVRLRRATDTREFADMRVLLGEQPPVWQVLWPDRWGCFPDDEHYDGPAQRLL